MTLLPWLKDYNRNYLEEQSRMSANASDYQNNYYRAPYSYSTSLLGAPSFIPAAPRKTVSYGSSIWDNKISLTEIQMETLAVSLLSVLPQFDADRKLKAAQEAQDKQIKLQQERAKQEAAVAEAKRQAELARRLEPGMRVSYVQNKTTGLKKFGVVAAAGSYTPLSFLENPVWAYWDNQSTPSWMHRKEVTFEGSK